MRSRNNNSSVAYSNDGYKNKSQLHNKFKKRSTVMDVSAENLKSRNYKEEDFDHQLSHSALRTIEHAKFINSRSSNARANRNFLNLAGNY
jgi:hypothetical protein